MLTRTRKPLRALRLIVTATIDQVRTLLIWRRVRREIDRARSAGL